MPVNSFDNYIMSWLPDKNSLTSPVYLSIAKLLEQDIRNGKLAGNTKLPPQRELADFLDLNLSTITRAFKICENKGLFSMTRLIVFLSLTIHQAHPFIEKPQKNGFKLFK